MANAPYQMAKYKNTKQPKDSLTYWAQSKLLPVTLGEQVEVKNRSHGGKYLIVDQNWKYHLWKEYTGSPSLSSWINLIAIGWVPLLRQDEGKSTPTNQPTWAFRDRNWFAIDSQFNFSDSIPCWIQWQRVTIKLFLSASITVWTFSALWTFMNYWTIWTLGERSQFIAIKRDVLFLPIKSWES